MREWTLQPPQWAGERQTSLKDRLRANQCVINGRIGKVRGQQCRGGCLQTKGQFQDGAEGGLLCL